MIKRIKYTYGAVHSWDYERKVDYLPSVEDIKDIVLGNSVEKKTMCFKVSGNRDVWEKKFKKWKQENPNLLINKKGEIKSNSDILLLFTQYYQNFKNIHSEKELKQVFKLKQQFMIKIL